MIPQNYTVDNVDGVRNPVGLKGHQLTVESHAVVGEATSLENVVRAVEGAGLQVNSMVLEPLASAEAVLSAEEQETGVVLVDIGGGTSDMAIFMGGVMAQTAVIPVGGFQFTNDLVVSLGIPYQEAEKAKLAHGHAIPDRVDRDETIEIKGYDGEWPHLVRARDLSRSLNDRTDELLRPCPYKAEGKWSQGNSSGRGCVHGRRSQHSRAGRDGERHDVRVGANSKA